MPAPSLIALVLHGSGRYYLEPLFAAARMPALQQLTAAGHQRYFVSEKPIAAGAWVTMLTGQRVGAHGVIDYTDRDARAYNGLTGRHASSATYRDQTIQTVLSNAGRRVASIYLPMTSPPWPINGMMISGFPLVDERHPDTYPPELAKTLPPFATDRLFSLRYGDPTRIDEYLRYNLERIEAVTSDACGADFDVVVSCIPTPDLAHHYFWRPDDPVALEHIYRWYDQVDAVMGRLWANAPPETTVVVFSDHGGRDAPSRMFGVNRWLAEREHLTPKTPVTAMPGAMRAVNRAVGWAQRHRLNHALAGRIRGRLRRRVSAVTHNTAFVDWSRTRAYGLDFICPLAGVEINLRGRQAHGIVTDAEYEPLRDQIIGELRELIDTETGRRVFIKVDRRDAWFEGPHIERFPDVIGELSSEYDVKGHLDLPITGPNPEQADYPFMGYHGEDAFFCARGPAVPVGVSDEMAPMVDLAPTLLRLAGVDQPPWMTGEPFRW